MRVEGMMTPLGDVTTVKNALSYEGDGGALSTGARMPPRYDIGGVSFQMTVRRKFHEDPVEGT